MKIELNPNKMTVEELNDVIKELTAQRERILENKRQAIATQLNLQLVDIFESIYDDTYDYCLYIKLKSGRHYRIPLDSQKLEECTILVTPATQEKE